MAVRTREIVCKTSNPQIFQHLRNPRSISHEDARAWSGSIGTVGLSSPSAARWFHHAERTPWCVEANSIDCPVRRGLSMARFLARFAPSALATERPAELSQRLLALRLLRGKRASRGRADSSPGSVRELPFTAHQQRKPS